MPLEVETLQIDPIVFQQTVEKKLADLPPLPAVVTRIMQTINDPNTSAEDLNRLISLDQGLSSKILRIVNSAYYGFPKRISTITHAVVILGFNTVRNLVLGVSAFGMLSHKSGASGLNRARFWEHSVATAVASSLLVRKKKPRTRAVMEEAFLAGLLHDIGKLFLDCYFPTQYAVAFAYARRENITLREAEQAVLGIDHAVVGRRIAEHWNFPPTLVMAMGGHHEPILDSDGFEAAAIVHAADWMAWQAELGSCENTGPSPHPAVEEWLDFSEKDYDELSTELRDRFRLAQDMLQLGRAA
jgi:putative nucleotidyltransferase with HDIG domain